MIGGVSSAQEGDASPAFLLLMELIPPIPFLRRIALFKHLLEEIRDFGGSSASASLWSADLAVARQEDKRLVSVASACNFDNSSDGGAKILSRIPLRYMEAGESFRELPYHRYQISEEVQEQVSLVKAQFRRAIERFGSFNSRKVSNVLSQPLEKTMWEYQRKNFSKA
ncbi:U-box domain-containing 10 -like protein [Gossypium arboreum]|uniref:U-box domain-containing 10-like protein n=1 Tax=Gossypium arboreum TaxID=29729 RepID=A0A0B0PI52_GOSAR|nr:U-box domain-containing 10 -like protein [Gossypium arboreum]